MNHKKINEVSVTDQTAVLDRFEGEVAVLYLDSDNTKLDVPHNVLPQDAKAGDHLKLKLSDGQVLSAVIDQKETALTRTRIEDKLARLRRGDHLKD